MNSQADETAWANLQIQLEGKLSGWHTPHSEDHAEKLVRHLRREGWRTPLTDHHIRTEPWRRGNPLRPETVRLYAQECREAIRAASHD